MKQSAKAVIASITATCIIVVALLLLLSPSCREHWYLSSRYWSRARPTVFYGRVVDQQQNPVSGAEVTVVINRVNPATWLGSKDYLVDREIKVTADAAGRFKVDGGRGTVLRITRINAAGFQEFPEPRFSRSALLGYGYSRDRGVPYYIPDEQDPAVFPLLKRDEERLIWPWRGGRDEPNPWR